MTDQAILEKSVTVGDTEDYSGGSVLRYIFPVFNPYNDAAILPPRPPEFWTPRRDMVLRSTLYHETFWASAIYIAATKMASKSWQVDGDIPLRVKNAHSVLDGVDFHGGWTSFIMKGIRDYLTTDNGQFFEVIRSSRAALNSQIIGLAHLDSGRCRRTGDMEIPVVYRDRKGAEHEMHAHEVVSIVDMPDPGETWNGVGMCSASRAYQQIIKQAAVEGYYYEKITGRTVKTIYFVNAYNEKQIKTAIDAAKGEADQKGVMYYMGAVIVPIPGDKPASVASVPLASLPESWDRKQELDVTLLAYADAIGLDPQELQPLTGQPLGTGAQSQVLDDKASGKGLAVWPQAMTHALNWWVIPDMTTFMFVEKDLRDRQGEATYIKSEMDGQGVAVAQGIATPAQAMQYLVDKHIYPKEFIPTDLTPGSDLSDSEKSDANDSQDAVVEVKEAADPGTLIESETGAAIEIVKSLQEKTK
jgi:hypothetical protein